MKIRGALAGPPVIWWAAFECWKMKYAKHNSKLWQAEEATQGQSPASSSRTGRNLWRVALSQYKLDNSVFDGRMSCLSIRHLDMFPTGAELILGPHDGMVVPLKLYRVPAPQIRSFYTYCCRGEGLSLHGKSQIQSLTSPHWENVSCMKPWRVPNATLWHVQQDEHGGQH